MHNKHKIVFASLLLAALCAQAADDKPAAEKPANEQVVIPQVDRRDVKLPRFPSKDFEVGVFTGIYSAQNFGSSLIGGVKLGYHLSEDVFVQAAYGRTKVSDESFRRILPGGVFPQPKETLSYYDLSAGYNVLPGEVFLGSKRAKATAIYLIAGVGSTTLNRQRRQTLNFGLGGRLLLADRWAVQVDLRDHVFSYDLLGERDTTHNIQLTTGLSYFF